MSDQAVQNIVSSAKTAVGILFDLLKMFIEKNSKEVKGMREELKNLKESNKEKTQEYNDLKKKIDSYEKANLDFEQMSNDVGKLQGALSNNEEFQKALGEKYKSELVNELKSAEIKKDDLDNYGKTKGLDGEALKKQQETDLKIDQCRQKALFSATEKVASEKLELNVPISSIAKDKSAFQKDIEKAITKSKKLDDLSKKQDLKKVKNDIGQEH